VTKGQGSGLSMCACAVHIDNVQFFVCDACIQGSCGHRNFT